MEFRPKLNIDIFNAQSVDKGNHIPNGKPWRQRFLIVERGLWLLFAEDRRAMHSHQYFLAASREKSLPSGRFERDYRRVWTVGVTARSFAEVIVMWKLNVLSIWMRPKSPSQRSRGLNLYCTVLCLYT